MVIPSTKQLQSNVDTWSHRFVSARCLLYTNHTNPKQNHSGQTGQTMIQSFKVVNLNHRMSFDLRFNDDINIVTGKNGSGKTTLLKLLWYIVSGNLERIVPEIFFDSFELVTDTIAVAMRLETGRKKSVHLRYKVENNAPVEIKESIEKFLDSDELNEANEQLAERSGSSIFFPTFRRIEGGFSTSESLHEHNKHTGLEWMVGGNISLQGALRRLSDELSVGSHRFVASIATDDIEKLLTSKYAEISEQTNRLHKELSQFILERVQAVPDKASSLHPRGIVWAQENEGTREALEEIQLRSQKVLSESDLLLQPFTSLAQLTKQIFQYRGIKLSDPVTLGDTTDAISSDVLSAGEKQMLSFLCYNAFANKSYIFIDEPEISLHVDWQRLLFPILLQQSTNNQFIVATHSPFIYSKYLDKELMLISDRGDIHVEESADRK